MAGSVINPAQAVYKLVFDPVNCFRTTYLCHLTHTRVRSTPRRCEPNYRASCHSAFACIRSTSDPRHDSCGGGTPSHPPDCTHRERVLRPVPAVIRGTVGGVRALGGESAMRELVVWVTYRTRKNGPLPGPSSVRTQGRVVCAERDLAVPEESPPTEGSAPIHNLVVDIAGSQLCAQIRSSLWRNVQDGPRPLNGPSESLERLVGRPTTANEHSRIRDVASGHGVEPA